MKRILFFACLLLSIAGAGQNTQLPGLPIPAFPTRVGRPNNAWLLLSEQGKTNKIDINDIASNKTDSVFTRNDSLIVIKNHVQKSYALATNSTTGGSGGGGSAITRTIIANGQNLKIAVYTGSNHVASVQTETLNGSGILRFTNIGDTTFVFYSYAPKDTITYIMSVIGPVDTLLLNGLAAPIFHANPASDTSMLLTWDKNDTAVSYTIEWSYDSLEYGLLAMVDKNTTSYTQSGLVANSPYYYRIRADGDYVFRASSPFSYASARTAALATLSMPSSFTATAISADSIYLQWNSVLHASGFLAQYSTDSITWYDVDTVFAANVTNTYHQILTANTRYYYRVKAVGNGEHYADSYYDTASATTKNAVLAKLNAPANFHATAVSSTQINLKWNSSAQAIGYVVEYLNGNEWDNVDSTLAGDTTASHTTLTASTKYVYRVKAIANNTTYADSPYSLDSATTQAAQVQPTQLDAPVIHAAPSGTTRNTITWNAITGATGFIVERSTNKSVWQPFPLLLPGVHTYTDTGLVSNTEYFYRAYATGDGTTTLNSAYSNIDSATTNSLTLLATPVLDAAPQSSSSNILTWNAIPNALAYRLQFSANNSTWTGLGQVTTTTFTHTGLTASTKYYYRVRAVGDNSTAYASSNWAVDSATTLASATTLPAPVPTAAAVSASQITISWNNIANETSYTVERSRDNTVWTVIKTLAANVTSYSDTGLIASTLYYYRVVAVGNGTTFLNSPYGYTSATTDNLIVSVSQMKAGLISAPAGSGLTQADLTMNTVDSMGMKLVRTQITLSQTSNPTNPTKVMSSGYEAQTNFNSYPPSLFRNFTLDAERTAFVATLNTVLRTYFAGKRDTLLVSSNEEINETYRDLDTTVGSPNNSAYNYVNNELKPLDSLAKAIAPKQFKVANGGWPGKPMFWGTWRNLMDSGLTKEATAFAQAVFTPAEQKDLPTWDQSGPHAKSIAYMRQLLSYYQDMDFDLFNVHIKLPINGVDSPHTDPIIIKDIILTYHNMTGLPIICNELGGKTLSPYIMSELLQQCSDYGMVYIVGYDGVGYTSNATSGNPDISFRKQADHVTLNDIGNGMKVKWKQLKNLK